MRTITLVVLAVAAVAISVAVLRTSGDRPTGPEPAGGPAEHPDPDYWTDERMRGARPAPMSAPPENP